MILNSREIQHVVHAAYMKVIDWKKVSDEESNQLYPNSIDHHMAQLLGFDVADAGTAVQRPEIQDKLNSLAGPHGYTIYKAMLARLDDGS